MPTSHYAPISVIMEIATRVAPSSVLEVGMGHGKYGVLCREYLDDVYIEGIEGFPQYVGDLHAAVYDEVHIADAREWLPACNRSFDLVLLVDVFEHFSRSEGERVLKECERIGTHTLISAPATWDAQDGEGVNPFQTHRAHYTWRDFADRGFQVWRMGGHLIALRSPLRLNLRPTFRRWAATLLAPGLVRFRDRILSKV